MSATFAPLSVLRNWAWVKMEDLGSGPGSLGGVKIEKVKVEI